MKLKYLLPYLIYLSSGAVFAEEQPQTGFVTQKLIQNLPSVLPVKGSKIESKFQVKGLTPPKSKLAEEKFYKRKDINYDRGIELNEEFSIARIKLISKFVVKGVSTFKNKLPEQMIYEGKEIAEVTGVEFNEELSSDIRLNKKLSLKGGVNLIRKSLEDQFKIKKDTITNAVKTNLGLTWKAIDRLSLEGGVNLSREFMEDRLKKDQDKLTDLLKTNFGLTWKAAERLSIGGVVEQQAKKDRNRYYLAKKKADPNKYPKKMETIDLLDKWAINIKLDF